MGEAQATLGLFSNTVAISINIGDEYAKKRGSDTDSRAKGKQLLTSPLKKGKTPDVTFQKFMTLAVGEPFVEMAIQQRRQRNENLKKQIVEKPFRPSSPSKKSTGAGTYYGTFSPIKYMKTTDDYDKRPIRKGEFQLPPKNIFTNPPRRGTYGMVGINIGGKPDGVAGEYAYVSQPVVPRPATAPEQKPKPFIPPSPSQKGTYGFLHLNINGTIKPQGIAGEYIYQADPISSARSHKSDTETLRPFRPSNPAKKGRGFYGTFKWSGQEYKEDPEAEKWKRAREERKREREKAGVFKPTNYPKSLRQTSICNHPRNQEGGHPAAVNARLFLQRNGMD